MADLRIDELRDIAKSLNLGSCDTLTKHELLVAISHKLSPKQQPSKYKVGNQIGNSGKEAKTYSVTTKTNDEYAMKTFRKNKSGNRITEEVEFQKRCAEVGISPKIIDYDTSEKFIVMEKMEGHLYDIIASKEGLISEKIQARIVDIFKLLDKAGVFHGDANILNYMYKRGKIYIIDFGFSKEIDDALKKKLNSDTPNMHIMLAGFIIKLKEMGCPESSYSILSKHLTPARKKELGL